MNQKDSHKNKPVTYYRIESMDRYSGETFGGFMAAVYSSLAFILDMRPDEIDTVDLIGVLNKSNPKAYELFSLSLELTKGLPIPEIYKINPNNYICLYRKEFLFSSAIGFSSTFLSHGNSTFATSPVASLTSHDKTISHVATPCDSSSFFTSGLFSGFSAT